MCGYSTSDFWVASFLKVKGFRILNVRREAGRSVFIFEDRPDREGLLRDFYNNASVGVNDIKSAAQDIRALIHNI